VTAPLTEQPASPAPARLATPSPSPDGRQRRLADERGVAATIVLFPVFFAVLFMMVQAIWWQAGRQAAANAADRTSAAVALHGYPVGEAAAVAVRQLEATGLRDVSVSISRGGEATVVVVDATAPGILQGTSIRVTARSVTPTERFRAP
jgi:hypothetical protein